MKILEVPFRLTKYIALGLASLFCLTGAISWIAARETIVTVAPVVIWIMAGCAILTSLVGTAALVIERSAWLKARRAEHHRDRTLATNEAKKSNLEIVRSRLHIKAEYKLMCVAVEQVQSGLIHPATLGDGAKFSSFPAAVVKHIDGGDTPLLEAETRRDLLPAIVEMPNILIVAGKGKGKSELLKWLEWHKMQSAHTSVVLDSHAIPGQWGGHVIGAGREYESIAAAMVRLDNDLDARFKVRKKHPGATFASLTTFIDEFTLLPGKLKDIGYNVQKYSKPVLTEGRKVEMNCIWAIHSARASALGLEGAMDLLECFDCIVYLKREGPPKIGDYFAYVDFGDGVDKNTKYNHPGEFTIRRPVSKVKILSLPAPAVPPAAEPIAVRNWPKPEQATEFEKKVLQTWQQMAEVEAPNWNKFHHLYEGEVKNYSTNQKKKYIETLQKFGIQPDF